MTDATAVRFLDRSTPPHIATLILLPGMGAAAMNIFLPSLNHMAEDFDVPYALMQLSVPVYLILSAVLQVVIGPVSDKFGRRAVTLWGVGIFLVCTIGTLLATSAELFLVFRMGQGTIAVGMVLSRAAVRDMYDQNDAASMIGYVTMGMALVPMIAPVIGGAMDALFGWRSIFWLLVILGALTYYMAWADMGETAISSGKTLVEQFREYPELINSPRFWLYALSSAFCSGAFFSYLGGAPFIGTEIYNMNAFWLGVFFGAPAVGYGFGNYLTGRLAGRTGVDILILWGCIISVAGVAISLVLILAGLGTAATFFGFMTFVGLGNGLVIPNATAGLLSVRPRLAGTASGLGGALMIGGGAVLSALAGSLLTVETGAWPLVTLQLATSLAGIVCILLVYRRNAQLRAAAAAPKG